jgi:leader peptidase (prepilin peptidase) / N-methyltransferase
MSSLASPLARAALRQPGVLPWTVAFAAVFSAVAVYRGGASALVLVPLLVALAVVVVVDLRSKLVPDVVTLPALIYALAAAAVTGRPPLPDAVLGAVAGGGLLLVVAVVSRGGVGGGDVKLMAVIGAALGWKAGLLVLAASQVIGALLVLALLIARRAWPRRMPLPIGSLLALLAAVALV